MSVISSYAYSTLESQIWGLDTDQTSKQAAAANSAKNNALNAYVNSTGNTSQLAQALNGVLDSLGLGTGDRITCGALLNYKNQLETDFQSKLEQGLSQAGIDPSIDFRLVCSADGSGVKVITDHPDKAKLEQFFADNPELVTQFEQIQSLTKLEEVFQNRELDVKTTLDRIRLENMSNWYTDTTSITSYFEGRASSFSGINAIA